MKSVNILTGDFDQIRPLIKSGDFVYLDPPYFPLTKTSNFTSYTTNGFLLQDQLRLKDFCDYLNGIGAFFLQSNSSSDDVFNLYKGYTIEMVNAKRSINSDATKRGNVKETFIFNYEIPEDNFKKLFF